MIENKFVQACRKIAAVDKDAYKASSIKRIKEVDLESESEPSEEFDAKKWKQKMFPKDKECENANAPSGLEEL